MKFAPCAILIVVFALCAVVPAAGADPEEQATDALAAALYRRGLAAEEEGDLSEAVDCYEDLIDDFPHAPQAPDALLRLGEVQERRGDLFDAFETYQRILDDYPGEGSLNEILQRQFRIGEQYLGGEEDGFFSSGLSTAETIFQTMVKTAPFSPIAPQAQYNLAVAIQEDGRYREAEVEYDLILENYAGSDVVSSAIFQHGYCAFQLSRSSNYDQTESRRALKWFQLFIGRYPDDPRAGEAGEMEAELRERLAEKDFRIGKYYQNRGDPVGALIYYRTVAEEYPNTTWAAQARERIPVVEPAAAQQKLLEKEVAEEEWNPTEDAEEE
ncbi:MAG TPA: outer membrane protein assembly factor BamD [bacterium]|nr:outer membrane protein assembly factor BamD [bacterium]